MYDDDKKDALNIAKPELLRYIREITNHNESIK